VKQTFDISDDEDLVKETPKAVRNNKRKAEADPDEVDSVRVIKKYRKNSALETVPFLSTNGFGDRIRKQIPLAVAKIGTPGVDAAVNKFVDKFLSQNGQVRFVSKKEPAPRSNLPAHPRSAALNETEQSLRLRFAALQEQAATWKMLKSKNFKPEIHATDLDFPGSAMTKHALDLLTDDEQLIFERCGESPADFRATLENIVLQSDELVLRAKQVSQFGENIDEYFSRVARALRREEIGDSNPLTFGTKQ